MSGSQIACSHYAPTMADGFTTSQALVATVAWRLAGALRCDQRRGRPGPVLCGRGGAGRWCWSCGTLLGAPFRKMLLVFPGFSKPFQDGIPCG